MSALPTELEVVDSHTEGEPTRVVLSGWPEVHGATMAERREDLRRRFDALRQAVVCEPRGHDAVVGALLTPSVEPGSKLGVLFFNNASYLGMCGHGLIGVVRTLSFLSRLEPGPARFDTPAGTVEAELHGDGSVSLTNVASRLHQRDVVVDIPGIGRVLGDVAYGGNWFFLVGEGGPGLERSGYETLLDFTKKVMEALASQGITGEGGAVIDHVELFGPPRRKDAHSRNFVLCPGGAIDRSPCGTGTSAKMASLVERGKLGLEEPWRQESFTGSLFEGFVRRENGLLVPRIRGRAYVTARSTLYLDPGDPFRAGFRVA